MYSQIIEKNKGVVNVNYSGKWLSLGVGGGVNVINNFQLSWVLAR